MSNEDHNQFHLEILCPHQVPSKNVSEDVEERSPFCFALVFPARHRISATVSCQNTTSAQNKMLEWQMLEC